MYSDSGICCSFFPFYSGQLVVTISLRRIHKVRLFHQLLKLSQGINFQLCSILVALKKNKEQVSIFCKPKPMLSKQVAYITNK